MLLQKYEKNGRLQKDSLFFSADFQHKLRELSIFFPS
jgi:hypothetical protein